MGCYGTWDIIMRSPGVFAAAAPQSCRGDPNTELLAELKDMPIWSMCGTNDSYFAGAQAMADAMDQVGATEFTFTAMQGVGHSINDRGYDYPGFIDWMFSQRLPGVDPPGSGGASGAAGSSDGGAVPMGGNGGLAGPGAGGSPAAGGSGLGGSGVTGGPGGTGGADATGGAAGAVGGGAAGPVAPAIGGASGQGAGAPPGTTKASSSGCSLASPAPSGHWIALVLGAACLRARRARTGSRRRATPP